MTSYGVARRTVDATSAAGHHPGMDPPRRRGPPLDQEVRARILAYATKHPNASNREIAREIGCSRRTVGTVLEPAKRIPGVVMRVRADLVAKAEIAGKSVNDVLERALAAIDLPAGWTPPQATDRDEDDHIGGADQGRVDY